MYSFTIQANINNLIKLIVPQASIVYNIIIMLISLKIIYVSNTCVQDFGIMPTMYAYIYMMQLQTTRPGIPR